MRIEVSRNGVRVAIITFRTMPEKFDSDYERVKFFKELHGWKQTVPRNGKKYLYHRNGILDEVPHIKIADSAFMVAVQNMKRVMDYFDEWSEKVECDMFQVMMNDRKKLEQLMKEE